MDARIGVLNSGEFYVFDKGYDAEPTIGTLEQVETALGLRAAPAVVSKAPAAFKVFNVLVRFKHPAWDEKDGLEYPDIRARSKSDANKIVRCRAHDDGHTVGRRAWFTATEQVPVSS
ncbi:hypothetical protein [Cupriavidus pinatubonensis]|uniref:Transposase IS4-like domain-containing protein n=1 Tax=Cupriavidus pinatubonensis TaxID=248026 RepID=A0ABM8WRG5_9BURK|nr:hypothetical protein [Cupriavidus pinatubonensis]CAG9170041.1 hypothetical protein LMG23994_01790 [Cupriavidus pinatubonensis]